MKPKERLYVDLPSKVMWMLDEMCDESYSRTQMVIMAIDERYQLVQARKPKSAPSKPAPKLQPGFRHLTPEELEAHERGDTSVPTAVPEDAPVLPAADNVELSELDALFPDDDYSDLEEDGPA